MFRLRTATLFLLGVVVATVASVACLQDGSGPSIDLSEGPGEQSDLDSEPAAGASLVFAVALVNSPRSTFAAYAELTAYLARNLDLTPKFIGNRTYAEINGLVEFQEATLAMVCSAPYVYGHDRFGMELLAVPIVRGQDTYQSYLIVKRDGLVSSWADLEGRTFAFTDPLSNSGRLVPVYELHKLGETPESFFERYIYTYSHDKSIEVVASGLVAAAAVDSLVYDYALAKGHDDAEETKIIWRSRPFPINPIVVHPGLDPALKERMRELLFNMHSTENGRQILDKLAFDRFVASDDSAYDAIRFMIAALSEAKP